MQVTRKTAHQMMEVLDELREELKGRHGKSTSTDWEKKRVVVKQRLMKLPKYVEKAASMVTVHQTTGRPKNGDLVKRTMVFLFARLMNKSNRDTEDLLVIFGSMFGIEMGYKSIERLYSDPEIQAALNNLFILLLKDEDISNDFAGDGTGYTLTVTKHYRSDPKKHSKDYRYAFRIIDIKTGMYVGIGYSARSEMEAFHQAKLMADGIGIRINSIRLDKYYSSGKILRLFPGVDVYVLPKKNISKIGLEWSKVFRRIAESPLKFLMDYFQRNLSENGYSSDKRRFGGIIRQKREDRQMSALFSIGLLHNVFFVRAAC